MKKSLLSFLAAMLLPMAWLAAQTNGPVELPPPPEEPQGIDDASGYAVLARIDKMLQENDRPGAEALAAESLDRINNLRVLLFGRLIGAQLAQDKIAEARALFESSGQKDPELARAALDLLHGYYTQKGDGDGLDAWTQQVIQMPLPEDLKGKALSWQLQAACAAGVSGRAAATVQNAAAVLEPEACRAAFAPALEGLIASGKYDDAAQLLKLIESAGRGKAPLLSQAAAARARIAIADKRWNDAGNLIVKNAKIMSDHDLAGVMAVCAPAAGGKEEAEKAEKICAGVIAGEKDKTMARQEAAACSLKISAARGRPEEIPAKLDLFLAEGMAPETLFNFFNNYFYQVVLLKETENAGPMLAFGKKLNARLDRAENKKQAAVLLVDGAFIAGDYAGALEIVEANKQLWEAEWSGSAKIKIGAHLALQNKQYKEAVEGFRKYMDYLAKNNEVLRDPLSGQLYTSDMMLGFNAMRIGDILREKLGDNEGARQAYDEAEQHFRKAAAAAGQNSPEAKYIDEQMSALASRRK